MGKSVVIALGGNAILQPKQEATYDNQFKNVVSATGHMVEIEKRVIISSLHMVMVRKWGISLPKMKLQKM